MSRYEDLKRKRVVTFGGKQFLRHPTTVEAAAEFDAAMRDFADEVTRPFIRFGRAIVAAHKRGGGG